MPTYDEWLDTILAARTDADFNKLLRDVRKQEDEETKILDIGEMIENQRHYCRLLDPNSAYWR